MQVDTFLVAYYLGLLVFIGNFVVMWRCVRTYNEVKNIEKRIVGILRMRKGRR